MIQNLARRIFLIYALIVLLTAVFGARILYYSLFVEANVPTVVRANRIPAMRGTIYDASGRVISSDILVYQAWLDFEFLRRNANDREVETVFQSIEENFGISKDQLYDYLHSGRYYLLLGSRPTLEELNELVTPSMRKYVSNEMAIQRLSYREYGLGRIIGSLDGGGEPVSGIEKTYDDHLRGRVDGVIRRTITGSERIDPVNGDDIYLSIDMRYQMILYEEIQKATERNDADGALALLLESSTGKIVAYAGSYDWDLGLLGVFEPGSSIKPLVYALALETGSVTVDSEFYCAGKIQPVAGLDIVMRDVEGQRHDDISFSQALVESCNVSTVQIGQAILDNLGRNAMRAELEKLGLGRITGVDLPGETEGLFAQVNRWSLISPYQFVIGQGVGVNIFQMSRALNVFASGGRLFVPSFVNALGYGPDIRPVVPVVESVLFSEHVVETLIPVLEDVVNHGTGTRARVDGIRIAGKTGTAQKAAVGGYSDTDYYALFWGFFPVEDPKYSLMIMVDTPKAGEYYGGTIAGPIFRDIVRRMYQVDEQKSISQGLYFWKVPDMYGYSMRDVFEITDLYGIPDILVHGTGFVVEQDPAPGEPVGDRLEVWLSSEIID